MKNMFLQIFKNLLVQLISFSIISIGIVSAISWPTQPEWESSWGYYKWLLDKASSINCWNWFWLIWFNSDMSPKCQSIPKWPTWAKWDTWLTWPRWLTWAKWDTWLIWPRWLTWAKWDTWLTWPRWLTWAKWDKWLTWPRWLTWAKWYTWAKWPTWNAWSCIQLTN